MRSTRRRYQTVPDTPREFREEVIRRRRSTKLVKKFDRKLAKIFNTSDALILRLWNRLFVFLLKNVGILSDVIRLGSFTLSVYLVNTGKLVCGITVGVLGILFGNWMTKLDREMMVISISATMDERRESERERRKMRDERNSVR